MKKSLLSKTGIFVFLLFVILSSCENAVDLVEEDGSSPVSKQSTNLSGFVSDESGNPASGVLISVDGNTTTTNAFGIYLFNNIKVTKSRFVVLAQKTGYMNAIKAVNFIKDSQCQYADLRLMPKVLAGSFNAQSGGTITLQNGSSIAFPPSAIIDASGTSYNGIVRVFATHINQDTPDFLSKIPGGDLKAIDASGQDKMLKTFGMVNVELQSTSGQKLNLAPAKKATLNLVLANSLQGAAPSSLPLWYFDEKKALWIEDGMAQKNGNSYVGDVSHFTWWNCDFPVSMCNIHGVVKDCLGNPLPNIIIQFNNYYTLTTNSQGEYSAGWPYTELLTAEVLASMNTGLVGNSNQINVGPFAINSINALPDLIVPCNTSRLQGKLIDCNGNAVSGFAVVTGTQNPTAQFCPFGEINIHVLPGLPVNIIAYVGNNSTSTSAISAGQGQATNIGTLQVCNSGQKNTIVMNGDSYTNQSFIVDTSSTNSLFSPGSGTTALIVSGYTVPMNKQCLIQIDFCGNSTGNYPLGITQNCNSDISMILDGVAYYPDDANSLNDFISVVDYGSIGEEIRGTFFSHLARVDSTSSTIPITVSGTFVVKRKN